MVCAIKCVRGRRSNPWMLPSLSKAAPLSKAICKSPSAEAVSTAVFHSSTTIITAIPTPRTTQEFHSACRNLFVIYRLKPENVIFPDFPEWEKSSGNVVIWESCNILMIFKSNFVSVFISVDRSGKRNNIGVFVCV